MDELGPDEQKWLDVLRIADEPRDVDRSRVRASVLASIGAAGAGAGAAASADAIAKSAAAKAATVAQTQGVLKAAGFLAAPWKIGVAVVSLVVAGGGATLLANRSPAASIGSPGSAGSVIAASEIASVAAPVISAPSTTVGSPPVVETGAVRAMPPSAARAATRPAPHTTAASHAADDVDAELALLTQAQQALKRGDANGALQALGHHAREHPHGTLTVEREGLRAVASCEAKRADGRALAERFVAANPQSPLVARVRAACLSPQP
jgi:hypothetical protein